MNLSDYFSLFFFFLFIYFFNLQTTSSRTERSSNFLLNITIGKRNFILYLKKKNKIKLKYRCELDKIENFINEWSNTCNNFIENSFCEGGETNKQRAPRYSYRVIEKWDVFLIPHPYTILPRRNGRHEKRKVSIVDRNAGANEERERERGDGDGLLYKSLAQVTVLARPLRKSIGH